MLALTRSPLAPPALAPYEGAVRPSRVSLLVFTLLALVGAGCAGGAQKVVRSRAAFDMDCPADALQLEELSQCSYGVRGCGKKAAYVVRPGSPDDQLCVCAGPCDAVLNLDVTPAPAAQP